MNKNIYLLVADSWQEGELGYFTCPKVAKAHAHSIRKSPSGDYGKRKKQQIWRIWRYPMNSLIRGDVASMTGFYDRDTDTIKWNPRFRVINPASE